MRMRSKNPIMTLQLSWRKGGKSTKALCIIAIFFPALSGLAWAVGDWEVARRIAQFLLIVAGAIWIYLENQLRYADELAVESRIKAAERAVGASPGKARPVWNLASSRLELYFQRNLLQVRAIFWATLLVMLAGFVLVGIGVYRGLEEKSFNSAVLTTCAGVLTEFIGATFLVVYRSTMKQAKGYVGTLERINAIGMCLQVLDSMSDEDIQAKNKTRSEVALKILESFAGMQSA